MQRIRVFVSFDDPTDRDLHDRLHLQSIQAGSTFVFSGRSEAGEISEPSARSARRKIREADEVVVLCSEHTAASERMEMELRIAQEEQKPYLFLWGRRDHQCTKPVGAKSTDSMYSWTRDISEAQMSAKLRNKEPRTIPEACKRP